MKVKLAEALLRRKELQDKVNQLARINVEGLFEVKVKRVQVTDSVDEVTAQVPKLSVNEVSQGYDYYARQLRLLDASIQQANWTTEVEVDSNAMKQFVG